MVFKKNGTCSGYIWSALTCQRFGLRATPWCALTCQRFGLRPHLGVR